MAGEGQLVTDQAIRLLHAKAAELENKVLRMTDAPVHADTQWLFEEIVATIADVSLVMTLLANYMEVQRADASEAQQG